MRLIDADALLEAIDNNFKAEWDYPSVEDVTEIITNAPTVQRELAKSYPKDCQLSDFHCTYPECGCGR